MRAHQRRAAVAGCLAVAAACVVIMMISSESSMVETSLESDNKSGGWTAPTVIAGDPPRAFASPQQGRVQAIARVARMEKVYPHTWPQGAVHASKYPYPEDGHPPPAKSAPHKILKGVQDSAKHSDAAVAAAQEATAAAKQATKVVMLRHSLDREQKDLGAPVQVKMTAPLTVVPPRKDLLGHVLPVPQSRRHVGWKVARQLRRNTEQKVLNQETKAARLNWAQQAQEAPVAGVTDALAKESRWKPAYKKAQEKATKDAKAAAIKAAKAQKAAALADRKKATAAVQAKAKAAAENLKHEAALRSIHQEVQAMQAKVKVYDSLTAAGEQQAAEVQRALQQNEQGEQSKVQAKLNQQDANVKAAKEKQALTDARIKADRRAQGIKDKQAVTQALKHPQPHKGPRKPLPSIRDTQVKAAEDIAWQHAHEVSGRLDKIRQHSADAQQAALAAAQDEARVAQEAVAQHKASKAAIDQFNARIKKGEAKAQELFKASRAEHDAHEKEKRDARRKSDAQQVSDARTVVEKRTAHDLAAASHASEQADAALAKVSEWQKNHPEAALKARRTRQSHHAPLTFARSVVYGSTPGGKTKNSKNSNIKIPLSAPVMPGEDDFKRTLARAWQKAVNGEEKATHHGQEKPGHRTHGDEEVLMQVSAHGDVKTAKERALLNREVHAVPAAQRAAATASATAINEQSDALQATFTTAAAERQAERGLAHVETIAVPVEESAEAYESREISTEAKDANWDALGARHRLMDHAFEHAQAAYDATTATYEAVQDSQKARRAALKRAAAQRKQAALQRAHVALAHARARLAKQTAAQLAVAATHRQRDLAEREAVQQSRTKALAAQQLREAHDPQEATMQQEISQLNQEASALRGQVSRDEKAEDIPTPKMTMKELHAWMRKGRKIDSHVMRGLERDIRANADGN